jgi:hypothetical protein
MYETEKIVEENVTEVPIRDEVPLASMEPKMSTRAKDQPKLESCCDRDPSKGEKNVQYSKGCPKAYKGGFARSAESPLSAPAVENVSTELKVAASVEASLAQT